MKSKALPIFILVVIVAALGAAIYHYRSDLTDGANRKLTAELKAKSGGDCWYGMICGDLAYYDCGAAEEGPAYFVNLKDKRTVGRCGSLCKGDMLRCQNECPPSAWACDLHTPAATSVPALISLNEELNKQRSLKAVLRPFDPPYPLVGAPAEVVVPEKNEPVFAAPADRMD